MQEIRRKKIPQLIDHHFGARVRQARYKYSDVVLSWIYSMLCGSERLEDTKQLSAHFKNIPETNHPSPDRIAGIFKSLSTETIKHSTDGADHEFNINTVANELMIATAIKLNLINRQQGYTMDYDNIILPCEKHDAKNSYKHCYGYCPGVAFIGKSPVYIEGRNGNSLAKYRIDETLQRSLDLLASKGINVKRFRSDAAAYTMKVAQMMHDRKIEFFIRAYNSTRLYSEVIDSRNWQKIVMDGREWEIGSADYEFGNNTFRVVVTRDKDYDVDKKNKYTNDNFVYRGIITNNREMTDSEVVHFYNQRGAMEVNFTSLNEDWNWSRLPFSFLNQNTLFMIMSAIGSLIFEYLKRKFGKCVDFVQISHRLKNFIFNFITVALDWVMEDEEKVPILYSEKDYAKVSF